MAFSRDLVWVRICCWDGVEVVVVVAVVVAAVEEDGFEEGLWEEF